jgi:hypothetical protein
MQWNDFFLTPEPLVSDDFMSERAEQMASVREDLDSEADVGDVILVRLPASDMLE